MIADIGAISGMVSSIKAAAEITKAMVGIRDAVLIQNKVIELNSVILSAQSSAFEANNAQTALLQTINELKKTISDLEAWETDKEKYDLKEITPHSYAYAIKEDARGTKPAHFICTACYENRKKSILQKASSVHLICPECRSKITFRESNFNRSLPPNSSGWT